MKVDVIYVATYGINDLDDDTYVRGRFVGSLEEGIEWQRGWGRDYEIEPFIRVIVTNVGRMPVTVEDIQWNWRSSESGWSLGRSARTRNETDVPFDLPPQSRVIRDLAWVEVSQGAVDEEGNREPLTFSVQLSNGTVKRSPAVKMDTPAKLRHFSAES